ncbi:PKD domain-containing protein [Candidatus Palauibacter sp.]|uniref:RNA polymerase sigma factor n=1 Tax=Candidatus Palauibacter sp. TaxID=3101350 RepID=UPI003B01DF3D
MTLPTPAGPSSNHILHPGSGAMRIMFRVLTLVTLVLAAGSMAPAWAATDGPPPRPLADTLSVTLAPPEGGSVTEGDTARFTVAVKGKAGSGDVTVRYAVSGTATAGEDYVALSGEVTLTGGARTGTIDLAVVADSVADGGETVILTLTDGTGPATVVVDATPATVTITDPRDPRDNQGPEADAGLDQTVDEGTLVNLDGSGSSDPEDDRLTFSWSQTAGPDVELVGADTEYPSFTAPEVDGDSTLTFRLKVTETHRNSSSASTNVTVRDVNAVPDCGSLVDVTIRLGANGSAACTDPEGAGPVTHTVLESPSVVSVTGGASVTWTGLSLGSGTARAALKHLRSRRVRREISLAAVPRALEGEPSPEGRVLDAIALERALSSLPDELRAVVVLKVVEGYSYGEIAELLGVARSTSEGRLFRARKLLRAALCERLGDVDGIRRERRTSG